MWLAPVVLVLERTGSAGRAGLVLAAATLPTLVSAPLIGAWLDAHGRRRTAITVHLAIVAGALAALLAGAPAILCAGVAGVLQPLVTGGFSSLVPALAPGPRSAALDSMTYNVASVAGPALVGVMAAVAGPEAAVACRRRSRSAACRSCSRCPRPSGPARPRRARDAARCATAPRARAARASPRRRRPAPRARSRALAPGRAARPFGRTLRAGLALLARHPQLRAVTLVSSLSQVGWGLINVVAPALAVALGARSADGGLLLAAIALGALVGAALLPRLHARGPLALVAGGTVGARRGARRPRAGAGSSGRAARRDGHRPAAGARRGGDVQRPRPLVAPGAPGAGVHQRRRGADRSLRARRRAGRAGARGRPTSRRRDRRGRLRAQRGRRFWIPFTC